MPVSNQMKTQSLIIIHARRLQKLKERQALMGINTPIEVLLEIENIEAEIRKLRVKFSKIKKKETTLLSPDAEITQSVDVVRVAMPAWEIGRVASGLGSSIGQLGVFLEEFPPELVKTAAQRGINLEIEILTPCFAHYDKNLLTKLNLHLSATIAGLPLEFDIYEHVFPDGQKVIYFWNEWLLGSTMPNSIYPDDPQKALISYASVSQVMAEYIKQHQFDVIHMQDYHVGLISFYLGDEYLKDLSILLTIHNATYQGVTPLFYDSYTTLSRINLSGEKLFYQYFEFFGNLNLLKACMLKVDEVGGRINTVSGDFQGTWGYAAELKENRTQIETRALSQKGSPPGEVFVPNCGLDTFEKLSIVGITNGIYEMNRPENLPELKADVLRQIQGRRGAYDPIFRNPITQEQMLTRNHNFDVNNLHIKNELKRLLHLEAFNKEPTPDVILFMATGRIVKQKNLGLIADIIERTLVYDGGAKFILLASAGDEKNDEVNFSRLMDIYPERVYFDNTFNRFLFTLILAGGDFCLIPSRFEPCGLVDYQAALLGNVVIGRATGGLTKVRHCAYLYDWLDISDRPGEANAFLEQIKAAIDTYRHNPNEHARLIHAAMTIDASWNKSAGQYIDLYLEGLPIRKRHRITKSEHFCSN